MRCCLLTLLTMVAVGVLALWFAGPLAAGYLIETGLGAAGFHGTNTRVEVSADPPLIILTGRADSVRLTATQVSVDQLRAGRVDLELDGVAVLSRHVDAVHGSFENVQLLAAPVAGQSQAPQVVEVEKVTLNGPSDATVATIVMTGDQAIALARGQLYATTGVQAALSLQAPDVVFIKVGGHTDTAHLVVQKGALMLVSSGATVSLFKPGQQNPFYMTSAVIGTAAQGGQILTLTGTIDVQSLLD
jgi:hypothetical protein